VQAIDGAGRAVAALESDPVISKRILSF